MNKSLLLFAAIIPALLFSGCDGAGTLYIYPRPASSSAQLLVVYACTPVLSYQNTVMVFDTSHLLFNAQNNGSVLNTSGSVPAGSDVNLTFKTGNGSANNILYSRYFNLAAKVIL